MKCDQFMQVEGRDWDWDGLHKLISPKFQSRAGQTVQFMKLEPIALTSLCS